MMNHSEINDVTIIVTNHMKINIHSVFVCFLLYKSSFHSSKLFKMPTMRGDAMRGLAVFISDIRNCKI
jgi:hypothetical protein